MKEGIIGLVASGLGFFVLVIVLIYAIVKTKKVLIAVGAAGLLLMLATGIWSAGRIAIESGKRVEKIIGPRSGDEIYAALFGKPDVDCVHVQNWQDQELPVIDFAIYLEVQTCPQEMARIAKRRKYEISKKASDPHEGSVDNISWFIRSALGDSVWVWSQWDEFGNGQEIFLSTDSTHFYCRDIAN